MRAYLLIAAMVGPVNQQSPTAEEILETVRQMNAWVQDLAFDWESRGTTLKDAGRVYAPLRTGHYRYRPADGAMWIEFNEYRQDGEQFRYSFSYFAGVMLRMSENLGTGGKQVTSEHLPKRYRFEEGDLPWQILNLPLFTDLSSKETPVELIGWENQSGHRCAHLAVYHVGVRDAGWHLWLDLSRRGHALRVELRHVPDEPHGVVKDIVLEEVPSPEGNKTWFPVKGTCESLIERRAVYRSVISITQQTIRFNQGLTDREFEITVPTGVAVSEVNRATKVPIGTAELPTRPTQVPTVVADTIRRAEHQKAQAEARSRARIGASWEMLVSGGLAGTAVVLLATVLYLRRARS